MAAYPKFPFRSEFPDSDEGWRNHKTLEDALDWARWTIHSRWQETNEYGRAGENTCTTARGRSSRTGIRAIDGSFAETIAGWSSRLLRWSRAPLEPRPLNFTSRWRRQRRWRERQWTYSSRIGGRGRSSVRPSIRSRWSVDRCASEWRSAMSSSTRGLGQSPVYHPARAGCRCWDSTRRPWGERPRYRPLGDPDNLSLKEADDRRPQRNTVYLWFKQGKFPAAVDVAPYLGSGSRPVLVVPGYRLEAGKPVSG
jgi:hypothetical protein